MTDVGIRNLSAYMRKMALNGYVLHVDLAPVKEIVSLQKDYTDLWDPSLNCWRNFRR